MQETQGENSAEIPMVTDMKHGKTGFKAVIDFIEFAVIVIGSVIIIRAYIVQPFMVSGVSMVPTFQDRNYLLVDELSYRFLQPHRGDVIIFRPPIEPNTYFIKRIIGLPGDTVTITNSKVIVTNASHPEGFTLNEPYITKDIPDDNGKTVVEDGEYFVMGDNRPASYDSRRWGLVPKANIAGRAFLRLYPLNKISVFPGEHPNY